MNDKYNKRAITKNIDYASDELIEVSHKIYNWAELGRNEIKSSDLLMSFLGKYNFHIEKIPDSPTAFKASFRNKVSRPNIAFLAEYDALPGIGHACGHNLIAAMSVGAAVGLSKSINEQKFEGNISVVGCPAEEAFGDKILLIKKNVFTDIDVALLLHPADRTSATMNFLAIDAFDFKFYGKESHSASAPDLGIDALKSVILLFNAVDSVREMMPEGVRIHGMITEGGKTANVMTGKAVARYELRTPTRSLLNNITEKVKNCAKGASVAIGTKLEIEKLFSFDEMLTNKHLASLFMNAARDLGENIEKLPLLSASTDMGNLSHIIPSLHPLIKVVSKGVMPHTKEFAEGVISEKADKALIKGSKLLALTAYQVMSDKNMLNKVIQEFQRFH